MPGLKKEEKKNLGNIKAMMGNSLTSEAEIILTQGNDTAEKLYAKTFERIGKQTRVKYEAGNPPRLHRLFFDALVDSLNGQKKGRITLAPIVKTLETSRTASTMILSCLETYGYLRITREENARGRSLIFEILREMP